MTNKQYKLILSKLRITPCSKEWSNLLGVGIRTLVRYNANPKVIPKSQQLLILMYEKHGVPSW